MIIGKKLKNIRKHYGFSQNDIAQRLNISQHNVSYYESTDEPTGLLEYIFKFCAFLNIPVHEFFMEDVEDMKSTLPDYITPTNAAMLKILNTSIDIETRTEVQKAFLQIVKAIILQNKDRYKHLPEYQELFGEEEEEGILKIADKKEDYKTTRKGLPGDEDPKAPSGENNPQD